MNTLPAGLDSEGRTTEIFVHNNELKAIYRGQIIPFFQLPYYLIRILRCEMRARKLYCESIGISNITDENEKLEAYVKHEYPVFDNIPDIDNEGKTNREVPEDALSRREREVLSLIASGETDYGIGEKLFISPFTVATHRHNVMQKLGFRNSAQASAYAVRMQLI
jgi:DNA-binding CsgD family transcriptional regulator